MPLRDAVTFIGLKVYGAEWVDSKIEHVITLIAEKCEAGEIAAAYRALTGVETLDPAEWRSIGWRNYFATGEIPLDLPLVNFVNGEWRTNKDGHTSRQPVQIFVRREHVDRLAAALLPQRPHPGGRPRHDWGAFKEKFLQLRRERGDFRKPEDQTNGWNSAASAAGTVLGFIPESQKSPDPRTMARYISKWVREIDQNGT
jgi:hypothetical protein